MPLVFPSSPTLGQTYSSGSSATYQWNGSYWDTLNPSNITTLQAISSSFASTLGGVAPATLYAVNPSTTVNDSTVTQITNWLFSVDNTNGQWNSTTGVFTAAYDAYYLVSAQLSCENITVSAANKLFRSLIRKNVGTTYTIVDRVSVASGFSVTYPIGYATALVDLTAGDALATFFYQENGSSVNVAGTLNTLSIVEVPGRIQR